MSVHEELWVSMRKFMDEQWGVMLGVKEYCWETMSIDEEL